MSAIRELIHTGSNLGWCPDGAILDSARKKATKNQHIEVANFLSELEPNSRLE